MTRLLAAAAAVLLAVPALGQEPKAPQPPAPPPPPKAAPGDAGKELNGTYAVKDVNFDGKAAPDELVKDIVAVDIKDGTITVRSKKKDDPAKLTVAPPADPKNPGAIDITAGGDAAKLGLYKWDKEKGELTIAFADKGARPADLSAGDGVRRLVLVKKDEKKAEPKKDGKDK